VCFCLDEPRRINFSVKETLILLGNLLKFGEEGIKFASLELNKRTFKQCQRLNIFIFFFFFRKILLSYSEVSKK
jgi:hypothetical protein